MSHASLRAGGGAQGRPWPPRRERPARTLTDGPDRPGVFDGGGLRHRDGLVAWAGPSRPADPAAGDRRLGHGEANLANYLWDGRRIRIVDFEDAAIADPASELAIVVEHLSARHLDADGLCARFDVDPVRLRAMFWLRLRRLLLPAGPAEQRNPPGTAATQARRLLDLLGAA
jgi:Phosphotransferase enzyme family